MYWGGRLLLRAIHRSSGKPSRLLVAFGSRSSLGAPSSGFRIQATSILCQPAAAVAPTRDVGVGEAESRSISSASDLATGASGVGSFFEGLGCGRCTAFEVHASCQQRCPK